MDVIVIGKKSFRDNDVPHFIYCGTDRLAAQEAINASPADFVRFYCPNPEPWTPMKRTAEASKVEPAAEAEGSPVNQTRKRK